MIMDMVIFWIFLVIGSCNALCSLVNSIKHGRLSVVKTQQFRPNCVQGLIFEKEGTGKRFCLSKMIKESEELHCGGCFCGQENKPGVDGGRDEGDLSEVGVVGGEEVGEHQYPWYAMILSKGKDLQ
jgi:hypothetical protein